MTAEMVLHTLIAQLRAALPPRVRWSDDLELLLGLLDHAEAEMGWDHP